MFLPTFRSFKNAKDADPFLLSPSVLDALVSVEETDPTSKNVTMTNGKRYSVGVVMLRTDSGTSVDVDVGGMSTQTFTTNDGNLENQSSSYFEDGIVFEYTGTTGSTTVEVSETLGGTGKIVGLIVREEDPVSGTVAAWSAGVHSGPQQIIYNNKVVMLHAELYSGTRYISYDYEPVGSLPIPNTALDDNDTYHQTMALIEVEGGIFVAASDHNGTMQGIWASTVAGLTSATPFTIHSGGTDTYAKLATYNDIVYLVTRSGATSGSMFIISGLQASPSSPTIVEDVLHTTVRHYPRNLDVVFDDSNNPLLLHIFQQRDGTVWERIAVAIYDIANDEWYDCLGVQRGTLSKGTAGTPRWSQALVEGETFSSSGISVLGLNGSNQRYTGANCAGRIREWNGTTRTCDVFIPFVDHPTTNANNYSDNGNSDLRICAANNRTRYVTTAGNNPFDMVDLSSYRLYWDCKVQSDDVIMIMTERRRRYTVSGLFDEDDVYPLYYDWGATRINKYRFTNVFNATSAAQVESSLGLLDTIEFGDGVAGTNNNARLPVLKADFLAGQDTYFAVDVAQNELHSTKRQAQTHVYDFTNTVNGSSYGDNGREVSNGVRTNSTRLSLTMSESDARTALIYTSLQIRDTPNDSILFRFRTAGDVFRGVVDFGSTINAGLRVLMRNSSNSDIINVRGSTDFTTAGIGITNILIAIDLDGSTNDDKLKIYVNDVKETLAVTTLIAGDMVLNGSPIALYKRNDDTREVDADVERTYIAFGQHLNIDTESNRRKFYDANGKPVSLGSDGSTPTGSAPTIYVKGGVSDHGTNLGDGGTLTQSGTFLPARNVSGDFSKVAVY